MPHKSDELDTVTREAGIIPNYDWLGALIQYYQYVADQQDGVKLHPQTIPFAYGCKGHSEEPRRAAEDRESAAHSLVPFHASPR